MEQQVRRKLRHVLNRLQGWKKIATHPDTLYYNVYAYGHEVALVMAALGLSHPVVDLLGAAEPAEAIAEPAVASLLESLSHYPPLIAWISIVLLAFWVFTRVTMNVKKLGDKVPLYRACRRELGQIHSDLDSALSKEDPLSALVELHSKAKEVVDRFHQADGWPWPVEPPNSKNAVDAEIERLVERYSENWIDLPADLQQREPAGVGS